MTFETEKLLSGKKPFTVVELILDFCSNTYGDSLTSPATGTCTASLAAGNECYNCRKHCQDTANFTKTTKTYSLTSMHNYGFDNGIPCIQGEPKFTPTELQPDKGASLRAKVDISFIDFPHHDRGIDPYVSTRTYTPESQGTFFGKLLVRNPYYICREMKVKSGYIDSTGTFVFETRLYVIDSITGPFRSKDKTIYKITGKDILKLADNSRNQIPAPSDGTLNADINDTDTSLVLDSNATVADYPSGGGTVVIGDEWIDYGSRSSFTLSSLTRGTFGTTADDHSSGDKVQIVKNFTGGPADILNDILANHVGINASYIPYSGGSPQDEWDIEQANWFSGVSLDAYFGEPAGAFDLINSLCLVFQIDLWWDEINHLIKMKANVPPLGNASVTELSDISNLVEDSINVKEMPSRRISRVLLRYDKIKYSDDNRKSNFVRHLLDVDADAESSNLYNEEKVTEIISQWLTSAEDGTASQTSQRTLDRFGDTPIFIQFKLEGKDASLGVGDLCDITTRYLQSETGATKTDRFQIIKKSKLEKDDLFQYDALIFVFRNRNWFIADNALDATSPMTVYDNATDQEKLDNSFIGPNTGNFPDGGALYTII